MKLDPVSAGWPLCLRIIETTGLLVKDVHKLTMGQNLVVTTPHAIEGVHKQPSDRWLSNTRTTHYQTLLINFGQVTFQQPASLNPATMLSDPDVDYPSEQQYLGPSTQYLT